MKTRAWHFVGNTLRDGRPVPKDGVVLKHDGEVEMCRAGLHASRDPFDALQYAPGPILCLVEVDDIVGEHRDKLVARQRKIVARMDATEMLRYFARVQALSVIHLYPDPPDVVLDYLMTGDEALREEARVVEPAAGSAEAAWGAAEAAWATAWSAARSAAAKAAAVAAAWSAARSAEAAGVAAAAAARAEFNQYVREAFADYLE